MTETNSRDAQDATPTPPAPEAPEKRARASTGTLIRRIWSEYVTQYLTELIIGIIAVILVAGCTALIVHQLEPVIDEIFINGDESQLVIIPLIMIGIFCVLAVSTYLQHFTIRAVGFRVVTDIQKHLYRRLIRADLRFFHLETVGEFISRFLTDTVVLREALATTTVALCKDMLTAVFLIVVMFTKDWQMALIASLILPATALPMLRIGRLSRKSSEGIQQTSGSLSSFLDDTLSGVRQVKAYGREAYEVERGSQVMDARENMFIKNLRARSLITPLIEVFVGIAIAAIIYFGGHRVLAGNMTPGEFFAFLTALLMMAQPIRRLGKLTAALQSGLAAADRLFQSIDGLPEIEDRSNGRELKVDRGEVRFRDVHFAYPDGTAALRGISLDCQPGETIALVGGSGGGKSTILNLTARFYDTSSGTVEIDGQPVDQVSAASLRAAMGFVGQDTALFDDTIRANIAYGRPDATSDQIEAAAIAANAHGFIQNLPQGYETVVGAAGFRLSGGQRQRIAIARAMLRDAPILLLDEATSALDTESERKVQAALARLAKGRSTIMVAHRLTTVVNADRIYVIEDGQVAECGSHGELLARNGRYAELYADSTGETPASAGAAAVGAG
ncbi:MAG: ABC transporter ATP-binding protein [Minwuia sp.]|nr:ABC transporter ATP-binding protein [Minwuia sp.]